MTHGSDRTINRVSVAASIGLVLMVVATFGYIGWPLVAGAIGVKSAPPAPAYAAGQAFDAPAEWYANAPKTLVIFARASCAACDKAQPFLKTLIASVEGRAAAVMAHPPGTVEEDTAFAKRLGIAETDIRPVTAGLRVRATPTIVLVDRQGMILAAFEGAGKPERQAEITKAIDAALR